MTKLIIVYGCHGAGKTTLVKNILQTDGKNFKELENNIGKYTLSQNGRFVAVGKYSIKCGGADSLKSTEHYYAMLDYLIETYPKCVILIEGIMLSHIFSRPLRQFLKYKYECAVEIYQVFLFVTKTSSYKRVVERSGKEPKLKNIVDKQIATIRTFEKFTKLNEFTNIVINTEDKTEKEVLKEFRKKMR